MADPSAATGRTRGSGPLEAAAAAAAGPMPAGSVPAGPVPAEAVLVDRSAVIGRGLRAAALASVQLVAVGVALFLLFWLLGQVWVGVRPVLLALLVSTVLWPPAAWLRRRGWPGGLAAAVVLVGALVLVGGAVVFTAERILVQSAVLASRAADGVLRLQQVVTSPPFNVAPGQIDDLTAATVSRLRSSATQIAAVVVDGVSSIGSALVTALLVLVLTFFFVKDGPRFLPWLRRETGRSIGGHLTEVCTRSWLTLGSFIRVQVVVSLVDAVFIGLGLVVLDVPLVAALTLLTFVAGFVPIIGAVSAGAVAVLVALVSNGLNTAVALLAVILLVQQLESNVLQPILQGRSLNLHPAVVLLAVTAGGTLFGIIGAFLAVPVAAVTATALRYLSEQISLRTGQLHADDIAVTTSEGADAVRRGEQDAGQFRPRRPRGHQSS